MTNYITPNANYDLFSTASYATLDTYLKNDPIVKPFILFLKSNLTIIKYTQDLKQFLN